MFGWVSISFTHSKSVVQTHAVFWEVSIGANDTLSVLRVELGWQAREPGSLQRLVKAVVWESQRTVRTEDSSLGRVEEGPSFLWNSAESNREPENGSKIGPDVVICMEGGPGRQAGRAKAVPGGKNEGGVQCVGVCPCDCAICVPVCGSVSL